MFRSMLALLSIATACLILPAAGGMGNNADVEVDPAITNLKVNVTKITDTKVEIEIVGTLKNVGAKTFKSGAGQQAVRLYRYPSLSFDGEKGKVVFEREFTALKAGQTITYRYPMTWNVTPGVGRIAYDYVFQIDYDPDIRSDGNVNNDDANLKNNKMTVKDSEISKKVIEALKRAK